MATNVLNKIIDLKLIFLISSSLMFTACISQQPKINNYPSYEVNILLSNATIVEVDDFGNTYVVMDASVVKKYNKEQQYQFTFDGGLQGEITMIDAKNPLKIMAFYPDFQNIKFLDNTLSEVSSFDLSKISEEISLVAMSNDNNIWIYDVIESKIKKVSNHGEILLSSLPISDIVGDVFDPSFLKESDNHIYAYDEQFGLIIFDFSGNFLNRIPLQNSHLVDIQNNQIITIDQNNKIWSESSNALEMTSSKVILYKAPVSPIDVQTFDQQIYLSTEKGIIIDDVISKK